MTIVDAYTREALTIEVDQGIKGEQVVDAVKRIAMRRGAPKVIRVDNGPEFVSKALDRWAYENAVTLDFSRPGKPTDNAFVESFNGRLRDECLNTHWFLSMADARAKIEAWRRGLQREPSSHLAWLEDAERIRCRSGLESRRMNAGFSPSRWRRNRGTLNTAAFSKQRWSRRRARDREENWPGWSPARHDARRAPVERSAQRLRLGCRLLRRP